METTRLDRRRIFLIGGGFAALLVAQYVVFSGVYLFDYFFAKRVEFKMPQGYKGTLFVSVWSNVRTGTDSGVFRLKLDGDAKEKISEGGVIRFRLDPKGTSLACMESSGVYSNKYQYLGTGNELFVLDQNGQVTHIAYKYRPTNSGIQSEPFWSPDGKWIILTDCEVPIGSDGFSDFSMTKATTWKYAKDGSSIAELSLPKNHVVRDVSPDGSWFLTSKNLDQTSGKSEEYFLVDANDTSKSVALLFKERVFKARFSPDGRKLFFGFPRENDDVHTIGSRDLESDGQSMTLGSLTTIVDRGRLGYRVNDFACSADGQFLAVANYDNNRFPTGADHRKLNANGHLYLVKLADGSSEELKITHAADIVSIDLR